jgi:segregation and condensation protein B
MQAIEDIEKLKRILETALLTSADPVPISDLAKLFEGTVSAETVRRLLDDLRGDWQDRGVELVAVASGWRFQARPEYQRYVEKLSPQRVPRYSRAVLETLAIIAYRQPVTRGDIEAIRGVAVSPNILKTLEARGWIDIVGHREAAGRPALYGTTKRFLDDLSLRSIEELPPLEELGSLVVAESEQGHLSDPESVETESRAGSDLHNAEIDIADQALEPALPGSPMHCIGPA